MLPLYEMMMQAQHGEAMKAMSRQFGLDESQVSQAMEALMPAFSTGLKRNAGSAQDIGNFMQALAGGQHARYFENLTDAFSPQGVSEGNGILGHLFGSKEVSRAVAQQAAQATGIGQEIFKQMLPVIATTLMGGMFKQSTGGGSGNPFADMMGQMMGQSGSGQRAAPAASNPLGEMMENMFGGGGKKDNSSAANPFTDMVENMMKMGFPGMTENKEPEPEENANPYDKLFGDMFDAGTKVQKDYQNNMDAIFDGYLKGMGKQ
jgi:hypothetical protein